MLCMAQCGYFFLRLKVQEILCGFALMRRAVVKGPYWSFRDLLYCWVDAISMHKRKARTNLVSFFIKHGFPSSWVFRNMLCCSVTIASYSFKFPITTIKELCSSILRILIRSESIQIFIGHITPLIIWWTLIQV